MVESLPKELQKTLRFVKMFEMMNGQNMMLLPFEMEIK
jgi:hypothetical protein